MLRSAKKIGLFVVGLLSACPIYAGGSSQILFSRDVLPILSENCFFCHGPDEENRSADLRLDTEDGIASVIDLTKGDGSELLIRIRSADHDSLMPPPDSNRQLTEDQISTLEQWVDQGAKWGRHWSFEPLVSPDVPPPAFSDVPVFNFVDAFVQRKLSEKKLRPSSVADPRTLLRRVTLDLIGLPPKPRELADFVEDTGTDRYERAVDRLLNSPAFGERMAWDWLDAARYADTNGYQGDRERTMWPWRDWVVNAFNTNMPFDQFTTQQLAGDLLPSATAEQKLATGFCRNHMINGEGGRIAEENRVDYVMDMSETMGTVWLGLTLNCCRCHDHKYDPLTQEDYYQFFAFFNQTPVTGSGGDPRTAPVLKTPTAEQQSQLTVLDEQLNDMSAKLAARRKSVLPQQARWEHSELANQSLQMWSVLSPATMWAKHQSLRELEDQSVLVGGDNAKNDTYTIDYPLSPGTLSGLRLEALQHHSMTKNGLARSDSGNFVLTEIEVELIDGETTTRMEIAGAEATFEQGSLKVQNAYDGNNTSGWAVYSGKPIDRSHAAAFRFAKPFDVSKAMEAKLRVVLRHDSTHAFHNLGRFRISTTSTAAPSLESGNDDLLQALRVTSRDRSVDQKKLVREEFLRQDDVYSSLIRSQTSLTNKRNAIDKAVPQVMVMEDQSKWRPTHVLNRGLYNDVTDREVTATTPASLPRMILEGRGNRLDLARWLMSSDHPLTARVTVNRFWQMFFGHGLVKTAEDFGVQAEYPEYKDLLDWLAAEFRDGGWNTKQLVKTIVMSHTYRQSSQNRLTSLSDSDGKFLTLADVDPENRLFARASRFRMPAWMLRDQALAIAGLLNRQVGGPPVNTYQPAGIWEEATFGKKSYKQDSGDKLYRRSLYIFWRRIIAPTMFFDNASRQSCTVKSLRTNTPLHALLTLNETTYVEAARVLAQQILTDSKLSSRRTRIESAFVRTVGRLPSMQESQVVFDGLARNILEYREHPAAAAELLGIGEAPRDSTLDQCEHAAWASACLMLFNMDEALNRE